MAERRRWWQHQVLAEKRQELRAASSGHAIRAETLQ